MSREICYRKTKIWIWGWGNDLQDGGTEVREGTLDGRLKGKRTEVDKRAGKFLHIFGTEGEQGRQWRGEE